MHLENRALDRRRFLKIASVSAVTIASGCGGSPTTPRPIVPLPRSPGGRLSVKPSDPTQTVSTGLQPLGLDSPRDGLRYVPTTYSASRPLPLLVLFHGAFGSAANWFGGYGNRAEAAEYVVLAIDSRDGDWDLMALDQYGDDLVFLDRALVDTFNNVAIDPQRIAVAGFSSGAGYSLSIGLTNGDLFSRVIAYTPPGLFGVDQQGMPSVFVSHARDDVFSIELTSRPLVRDLRAAGYDVEFVEFDGGHQVPQRISDRAFDWLAESWKR